MCCNRRSVTPQKQSIPKPIQASRQLSTHRITAKRETIPLEVRQKSVNPTRCGVCGYPIHAVNISGKTIMRCSNQNCGG